MKNVFLSLILSISFISSISAQEIISYEFLQNRTSESIQNEFENPFSLYDVDLYKIVYTTKNAINEPDTASGLLLVPLSEDLYFPRLCYQHGTVGSRDDVPSNLQGGYQLPLVLASIGYLTTAADFIGLGESPGNHPYIHSDSEASAAIDMLIATKTLGEDLGYNINEQLFITGYSQGGHAGMAAHKEIEENYSDQMTVTAASHMSGPYSVSGKMIDFSLGDDEYFFVAYLVNVAISMKTAYPQLMANYDLEDIFKPEYLDDMYEFRNEEIDLFTLNERLIDKLETLHGASKPKYMIQDSILPHLLAADDHPVPTALKLNDLYDWTPQAPTRLMYCQNDDQVFYENSVLAEEVMLANGTEDIEAIDVDSSQDHGGCVTPATTSTVVWWFNYRILSTDKNININDNINVFPNPTADYIEVNYKDLEISSIELFDFQGRAVKRFLQNFNRLDVQDVEAGNYLLMIKEDQNIYQKQIHIIK